MTADRLDLGRLRLIVRRFEELQGFRMALVGVVWSVVFGVAAIVGRSDRSLGDWTVVLLILSTLAPISLGMWWLDRYYLKTFGRAPKARPARWRPEHGAALVVVVITIGQQMGVGLMTVFLYQGMSSVWIVWRDRPYRLHHVIGAVAGFAAAATALASGAPGRDDVTIAGLCLLGVGLTATGLLDHRLLASRMPGRARSSSPEAPEREPIRQRRPT